MSVNNAIRLLDADVPTNALDMVARVGLDDAMFEGYGPGYVKDAMLAAMPTIRRNLEMGTERVAAARDFAFAGADSGVFDKQNAELAGQAVSQLGGVINQAEAENEARKGQAQGTVAGVLSSYDSMVNQRAMARAQLEAQRKNRLDYTFKGLSTAAAFMPG